MFIVQQVEALKSKIKVIIELIPSGASEGEKLFCASLLALVAARNHCCTMACSHRSPALLVLHMALPHLWLSVSVLTLFLHKDTSNSIWD